MACDRCHTGWTSPCRYCDEPIEEEECSMEGCPNCGDTESQLFICAKETEDTVKICKECRKCKTEYSEYEDK